MHSSINTTVLAILLLVSCPCFAEKFNYALEEIIVTAQKRPESMQDIPAAFSVYGADTLETMGWKDIGNMAELVPSLEIIGNGKSRSSIFIRGVGTNKYDIGTESSVGIFVDGVYVPRFSSVIQSLIDLERIEVLRGPQGTLYGRNTIGGSISLYSKELSKVFQTRIIGSIGNVDSHSISAIVHGGVSDHLILYGGFSVQEIGGFRKEISSGKSNDEELQSLRLKASYTPNDNIEAVATVDWSHRKSEAFLTEIFSPTGEVLFIDPSIPQATLDAIISKEGEDFYNSEASEPGFTDVESYSAALNFKYYNDDIVFESITGYRDEDSDDLQDSESTILDVGFLTTEQTSETLSQEFKLSSEEGGAYSMDDKLEWLVGMFFYQDKAYRSDQGSVGGDSQANVIAFIPPFTPPPYFVGYVVDLETTSWAAFTQVAYYLTEEISATLGIRFSRDTKTFSYSGLGFPEPFFSVDNFSFNDTLRFESTDPKIVLEYEPLWALDLNLYASYQQGYKSGGVQYFARNIDVAQESFDKETLIATEVGFKSRWLDQKLQINASTYVYDYSDQQIEAVEVIGSDPQILTTNAGASTIKGFEVDFMFMASADLLLQLSYSYIDAVFDEFSTTLGVDRSGNVLPAAPRHSYLVSGEYTKLVRSWEAVSRVDYAWRDEQVFSPDGNVPQGDYGLLNASITLTDPGDEISLRLECSNCADTKFRTQIKPLTELSGRVTTGARRRFNVQVSYTF